MWQQLCQTRPAKYNWFSLCAPCKPSEQPLSLLTPFSLLFFFFIKVLLLSNFCETKGSGVFSFNFFSSKHVQSTVKWSRWCIEWPKEHPKYKLAPKFGICMTDELTIFCQFRSLLHRPGTNFLQGEGPFCLQVRLQLLPLHLLTSKELSLYKNTNWQIWSRSIPPDDSPRKIASFMAHRVSTVIVKFSPLLTTPLSFTRGHWNTKVCVKRNIGCKLHLTNKNTATVYDMLCGSETQQKCGKGKKNPRITFQHMSVWEAMCVLKFTLDTTSTRAWSIPIFLSCKTRWTAFAWQT